jgi:hypothetical protein
VCCYVPRTQVESHERGGLGEFEKGLEIEEEADGEGVHQEVVELLHPPQFFTYNMSDPTVYMAVSQNLSFGSLTSRGLGTPILTLRVS